LVDDLADPVGLRGRAGVWLVVLLPACR
jgi:hypothetical protein